MLVEDSFGRTWTLMCAKKEIAPYQAVTAEDVEVGGEGQPHLTINCGGRVHVVPESFFQDVIDGRRDFTDADDWQEMLRTILKDWLVMLKEAVNVGRPG